MIARSRFESAPSPRGFISSSVLITPTAGSIKVTSPASSWLASLKTLVVPGKRPESKDSVYLWTKEYALSRRFTCCTSCGCVSSVWWPARAGSAQLLPGNAREEAHQSNALLRTTLRFEPPGCGLRDHATGGGCDGRLASSRALSCWAASRSKRIRSPSAAISTSSSSRSPSLASRARSGPI